MYRVLCKLSPQPKASRKSLLALAGLAVLTLLATLSPASAQTVSVERAKKKQTSDAAGAAGQQAAVDPKTGKLRQPTAAESQALSEQFKRQSGRAAQTPVVTYRLDGSVSVDLTPEYMDAAVVKLNPDGSLSMECVTGLKAAEAKVLEGTAKTADQSQTAGVAKRETRSKQGARAHRVGHTASRRTAKKSTAIATRRGN
jgi:hypothetical protein